MKRTASCILVQEITGVKDEIKDMNEMVKQASFDIKSLLTMIEAKIMVSKKDTEEIERKTKAFEILNSKRLFPEPPSNDKYFSKVP